MPPDAPEGAVGDLVRACRRCGRCIPEVLDSVVGWNRSRAPVQLVWEHAYESVEAYGRYMVHPYHAAVLDRYLLQDSPERVVVDDTVGVGLFGYVCAEPEYRMATGVRRVVLLRVEPGAPDGEVERLREALVRVPRSAPGMTLSVFGENTLGPAWFDGVTPITGTPRWTHVWEQGFATRAALDSYLAGEAATAEPGQVGTDERTRRLVRGSMDLVYDIDVYDVHDIDVYDVHDIDVYDVHDIDDTGPAAAGPAPAGPDRTEGRG